MAGSRISAVGFEFGYIGPGIRCQDGQPQCEYEAVQRVQTNWSNGWDEADYLCEAHLDRFVEHYGLTLEKVGLRAKKVLTDEPLLCV